MDSEHKIRPMRNEDWNDYNMMMQEVIPDDMLRKDQFLNSVKKGNFYALEIDAEMAGQLKISRFGSEEAHLGSIGVAKSHRRKGLGSILMRFAIDWFEKQEDVSTVHLYTQDHNIAAQSMYKKFGFNVTGTTWHFFVPFKSLKPLRKYTCQEIHEDEIDFVGTKFPSLPPTQIRRFLEDKDTKYYVLTLKDGEGDIVGVARFTPSFPGSFPFEIIKTDCFDDFIRGMEKLSHSEFDHVRIVFTDNEELAEVCKERKYPLHHKLFRMTLNL